MERFAFVAHAGLLAAQLPTRTPVAPPPSRAALALAASAPRPATLVPEHPGGLVPLLNAYATVIGFAPEGEAIELIASDGVHCRVQYRGRMVWVDARRVLVPTVGGR